MPDQALHEAKAVVAADFVADSMPDVGARAGEGGVGGWQAAAFGDTGRHAQKFWLKGVFS